MNYQTLYYKLVAGLIEKNGRPTKERRGSKHKPVHHIEPRSTRPDLINNYDNTMYVSIREHILLHLVYYKGWGKEWPTMGLAAHFIYHQSKYYHTPSPVVLRLVSLQHLESTTYVNRNLMDNQNKSWGMLCFYASLDEEGWKRISERSLRAWETRRRNGWKHPGGPQKNPRQVVHDPKDIAKVKELLAQGFGKIPEGKQYIRRGDLVFMADQLGYNFLSKSQKRQRVVDLIDVCLKEGTNSS